MARCSSPIAGPRPEHRRWTWARRPAGRGRAGEIFEYLDGRTPHRLRRSALTHDAEGGTSTPMLLARSRHASVRSLDQYARPGVDAVARLVAERDLAVRRRNR
ncbi:hypothetical protein [Streptomyces acidiscabies]|uniref:hypothetical protein n=1 Tax=Streptomyces acidiscabies TaxID=42234 RepID=UPI0038F6A63A